MKTNNFLWATLATAILTLTGCSSDDNELTVPQPQDKTALLELRLIGNGINTKATGDDLPTQAEENTVKHFTVAIFNSDNTVNTLHTVTENTASATTISCTPATDCTGIVVANAPSDSYFTGKCLGIHGESVTITATFYDTDMIVWDARQCWLLHLNW